MQNKIPLLTKNYHTLFSVVALAVIFYLSLQTGYLLFHTIVELFSIVIAFAVFIVTWNSRKILDNNYLFFVGIAAIFIASLDLMHTITYKGMNILGGDTFYANQFWVATRFIESVTLLLGFSFLKSRKKLNAEFIFLIYFIVSALLIASILYWKIFPICFIEGKGQTPFKIYSEYVIMSILVSAGILLFRRRRYFTKEVFELLAFSIGCTIISEFCFTLYVSNYGLSNQIGHYAKLLSFYLIYKANVVTGFNHPTQVIFKDLKDREEQYRTLAENLPEMIMRLDKKLNCIYSNNSIRKFIPNACDSLTDKNYTSIGLPEQLIEILKDALDQAAKEKTVQEVNFNLWRQGKEHFFSMQVVPENFSDSELETYLIICFDITSLKTAEQKLRELNITKDKLFSIIAHDLKNPFTSMLGFSDLLHKNAAELSSERIQHFAERMHNSAHQAYTLLENLLNWSRIQTGNLTPSKQVLDAAELVREALRLCSPMAETKGIAISVSENGERKIVADRQMINTVLRNLVTNAIKFTYPGGTISVETHEHEGMMLFSVIDSGMGIEKQYQGNVLKIDNKFSQSGTANEKGTGLGLVLCKEFVELNGGTIWFESEFGQGTSFHFTLPLV